MLNAEALVSKNGVSGNIQAGLGPVGIGLSRGTETHASSYSTQAFYDINGDSIPDIVQTEDGKLKIYGGSRNSNGSVTFSSQNIIENISNLSYNTTSGRVSGISLSPNGGVSKVTPLINRNGTITGVTTKASATPSASAGTTISEGESISSSGFVDINGDGLIDYFDGSSFRLGTGKGMFSYNAYSGVPAISDITSQSFGMNVNLGVGVGSGLCLSVAIFSANAAVGVTYGSSSSVVNQKLMDINGDGLLDMVSMDRGSTRIKVRYNKGKSFTEWSEVQIPTWGSVVSSNQGAFYDMREGFSFDTSKVTGMGGLSKFASSLRADGINAFALYADKNAQTLEWNSSVNVSLSGSFGASVTIKIPLFLFVGVVNITTEGNSGLNYDNSINTTSVKMTDLNGDGSLDHVLRIPGVGIYWKKNITGKVGLLNKIYLPQGGEIRIEYAESYGTEDSP